MGLQVAALTEALHALITAVGLLPGVGTNVDGHHGFVMAVPQWALPFSVDTQDPQLPVVTGHVGGARGVHMQTLRGGARPHAAVSKCITVFGRDKTKTEKR